jgi:hypothetical protein
MFWSISDIGGGEPYGRVTLRLATRGQVVLVMTRSTMDTLRLSMKIFGMP